jgi:hypothetical protein
MVWDLIMTENLEVPKNLYKMESNCNILWCISSNHKRCTNCISRGNLQWKVFVNRIVLFMQADSWLVSYPKQFDTISGIAIKGYDTLLDLYCVIAALSWNATHPKTIFHPGVLCSYFNCTLYMSCVCKELAFFFCCYLRYQVPRHLMLCDSHLVTFSFYE